MRRVYLLALLFTALIWAGSFIFIKLGLREIGPYNMAFYRFAIASPVLLLAVYLRRRLQSVERGDIPSIVILAITGVTSFYVVQFVALVFTTATNASILINTSVIFIAVISLLLGERFTGFKTLGIIMSFIGVILVISNGEIEFFSRETFIGDALMMLCGLFWAIYTLLGKRMLEKYNPEALIAYASAIGSVLLLPFAIYEGLANPFTFSPLAWISLLYLSLLSSVLTYFIWYSALTVMEATEVAVFTCIVPLFAAMMAFLVLGDDIGIFTSIGGVLTVVGVYLVERE